MSRPLPRRRFLRGGTAAGIALAAPTLWIPRDVFAGTEIKKTSKDKYGTTILLGLEHGPFPARGSKYKDNTCLVFVPKYYRLKDQKIDTLVHFHGHRNTAVNAVKTMKLRQAVWESGQDIIFIAPQGPVNANDSSGGKLERDGEFEKMLGEVRTAIQRPAVTAKLGNSGLAGRARIGRTAISAHSGGYRVAAACLKRGGWPNVRETYLFDALYGERKKFFEWVLQKKGTKDRHSWNKLVTFYTKGAPREQCTTLRNDLESSRVSGVRVDKKGKRLNSKEGHLARVIFIDGKGEKHTTIFQDLRDCLLWSDFSRHVKRDFWEEKHKGDARDRD